MPPLSLTGIVTANLTLDQNGVTQYKPSWLPYPTSLSHGGFTQSGLEFAVNLTGGSGAINNARLHGDIKDPMGANLVNFDLSGGTGTVNNGQINITNWTTPRTVILSNNPGDLDKSAFGTVGGTLNISSDGKAVTGIQNGTYFVKGTSSQAPDYVEVSGGFENVGFKPN